MLVNMDDQNFILIIKFRSDIVKDELLTGCFNVDFN